MGFNETIIGWYQQNKRDLPWRGIVDPYRIWLSEIILQQTRVDQGVAYYNRFLEAFPEITSLAGATEQQVIKYWQGLGYYSRARNLHRCAKIICKLHDGVFPKTYKEVLSLPGIGTYTAAAIVSLSYGMPYPSVDGNVMRFISRCFGVDSPIDRTEGKKIITQIAGELMDKKQAGIYNQALIEMGAMICKPRNPACGICSVRDICFALKHKRVDLLPYKRGKVKVRERYFNYLVICDNENQLVIRKRTTQDIWKNMYDFPLIESEQILDIEEMKQTNEWNKIFKDCKNVIKVKSRVFHHKLSHQNINAIFWSIQTISNSKFDVNTEYVVIKNFNMIHEYPIPKLIENYCAENSEIYGLMD